MTYTSDRYLVFPYTKLCWEFSIILLSSLSIFFCPLALSQIFREIVLALVNLDPLTSAICCQVKCLITVIECCGPFGATLCQDLEQIIHNVLFDCMVFALNRRSVSKIFLTVHQAVVRSTWKSSTSSTVCFGFDDVLICQEDALRYAEGVAEASVAETLSHHHERREVPYLLLQHHPRWLSRFPEQSKRVRLSRDLTPFRVPSSLDRGGIESGKTASIQIRIARHITTVRSVGSRILLRDLFPS